MIKSRLNFPGMVLNYITNDVLIIPKQARRRRGSRERRIRPTIAHARFLPFALTIRVVSRDRPSSRVTSSLRKDLGRQKRERVVDVYGSIEREGVRDRQSRIRVLVIDTRPFIRRRSRFPAERRRCRCCRRRRGGFHSGRDGPRSRRGRRGE